MELSSKIRDVADFPSPGILFKDITTLLQDGAAFNQAIDELVALVRDREIRIDKVVAIESRGFIFGAPVAYRLGVGLVPVRKLGKLPGKTINVAYELEYGSNTVEMHVDAVSRGERVLVVDDLLATGGTTRASCDLVEQAGGIVSGVLFLIELDFLHGRKLLEQYEMMSLLRF